MSEKRKINYDECVTKLKARKILRNDWMVHERRSESDPMYRLLYFPTSPIQDENDIMVTFVDRLLRTAMEIIEKRYGQRMHDEQSIQAMLKHLRETDDHQVKIFFLLFVLHWEQVPFADHFEQLYNAVEDTLFGIEAKAHFRKFMAQTISSFVEKTLNFAYNKFNVITTVQDFTQSASLEYIMGPLP
jgi:hypothetical protein